MTREYRLPIPSDDQKIAWLSIKAAKRPVLLHFIPEAWNGEGGWCCWTFGGDYRTLRRGTKVCLLEETKPAVTRKDSNV